MKCEQCGQALGLADRFCAACGGEQPAGGPVLAVEQLTPDLLAELLRQLGYEVKPLTDPPGALLAGQAGRRPLVVTLRPDLGVIIWQAPLALNPTDGERWPELHKALNRANGLAWLATFYLPPDRREAVAAARLPLFDLLTPRQLLAFLERFEGDVSAALTVSGLDGFLAV